MSYSICDIMSSVSRLRQMCKDAFEVNEHSRFVSNLRKDIEAAKELAAAKKMLSTSRYPARLREECKSARK